jgi:hypothetical protein
MCLSVCLFFCLTIRPFVCLLSSICLSSLCFCLPFFPDFFSISVCFLFLSLLPICLYSRCLSVFSSFLFVCLSVCRSSVFLSVCLSFVCLSFCLSIFMFFYLSTFLSACLSTRLYVCLSVCLSACLSTHLSAFLSVCLTK